jgi:hypothetical protein
MNEKFSRADVEAAREQWFSARDEYGPDDDRTVQARDRYRHIVRTRDDAEKRGES